MKDITKYLSDIIIAIDLIENFMIGVNNFNQYDSDLKTQSAVERQLLIVGEALNRVKKEHPDIKIKNAKQIIGFRNRLAHAYDSIDNSIVWATIKLHLDGLKTEINSIENNNGT